MNFFPINIRQWYFCFVFSVILQVIFCNSNFRSDFSDVLDVCILAISKSVGKLMVIGLGCLTNLTK